MTRRRDDERTRCAMDVNGTSGTVGTTGTAERMSLVEATTVLMRLMGKSGVSEEEVRAIRVGIGRILKRRTDKCKAWARKHALKAEKARQEAGQQDPEGDGWERLGSGSFGGRLVQLDCRDCLPKGKEAGTAAGLQNFDAAEVAGRDE